MYPNVGAKINMLGQKKTKIQNMRKSNNLLSKKQKNMTDEQTDMQQIWFSGTIPIICHWITGTGRRLSSLKQTKNKISEYGLYIDTKTG